ncbi:putative suppressor protein [Clavispora lusitaniae]|uniref:Suppressor protein n=1 Tax=Clavispora lusitaniae TaxID=36911 RepID=A0AA91Q216_CLALS|nr:putative suppressor protein [Clavispora lusitaniae]
MSFENKNLYALLGNDVEDDVPAPAPKEIVKKTTSSKKADVPPPSADPARAKKQGKKVTGNEAAFKNKPHNKDVSAPTSTPPKHQKKTFDRHSRTGKTDSKKKVRQAWGGDDKRELEDETAAAGDAAAELAAEGQTGASAGPAAKSLQEYLAELQKAEAQLEGRRPARQANQGAEDKWTAGEKIEKQTLPFFESQSEKKVKQKATKPKKYLDFNAVFTDSPAPRSAKKPFKKDGKPAVDDKNFPSL